VWQIAADGKQKKLFESHYAAWHHMGELWGLSPHPSQARFATCGDDRTVRTWDVVGRKEINKAVFEGLMRAIAYSPDGKHLACAFGGRLGGKEDGLCGAYKILNAETLEVVAAGQDSDAWIQEIRYSPDGTTLAIGSHDDKVYLYDVAAGYKKKAICKGHSSFITHIDFTADSRFLHTNCGAYELLFWDANTGKQDPDGGARVARAGHLAAACGRHGHQRRGPQPQRQGAGERG
jgi:WD40 repeat protein